MAFAGPQIHFGQEIRGYALLMLLGVSACWAIILIEKRGPSPAQVAALGGCVLAMVLSHYFSLGGVVALFLYGLVRLRGAARVASSSPLPSPRSLPSFPGGRSSGSSGRCSAETTGSTRRSPTLPSRNCGGWRSSPGRQLLVTPLSSYLLAGTVSLVPLAFLRRRPDLLIWACWLGGVVAVPLGMDIAHRTLHISFVRYTFLASPAVFALIAAGFTRWPSLLKHLVPAAMTLLCVWLMPVALAYTIAANPDWKPVGVLVREEVPPGETIVFTSYRESGYWCYLFLTRYGSLSEHPIVIMTKTPGPELLATLGDCRTAVGRVRDRRAASQCFPCAAPLSASSKTQKAMLGRVKWGPGPPSMPGTDVWPTFPRRQPRGLHFRGRDT